MAGEITPIQLVVHRTGSKDNLQIWGKLYVDRSGQTSGGWHLDSWSVNGAPYWLPKMHWLSKQDNKLYVAKQDSGKFGPGLTVIGEDGDIEPDRAKFIRENVAKWEQEWIEKEFNKP
jgi:hypothetical protein